MIPIEIPRLWILTLNPSPNKLINKRRWQLYDNCKQEAILTRVFNAMVRDNPTVEKLETVFEKCPSNGQTHLHGLFRFPSGWLSTVENYLNRVFEWKDDKSIPPWRHLHIDLCKNRLVWEAYMAKDQ